jgi:hypothetical protein
MRESIVTMSALIVFILIVAVVATMVIARVEGMVMV